MKLNAEYEKKLDNVEKSKKWQLHKKIHNIFKFAYQELKFQLGIFDTEHFKGTNRIIVGV